MALQCTEEADIKVVEVDSNKGDSSKDTKEAVLTNLVEADMVADVDSISITFLYLCPFNMFRFVY